MRIDEIILLYVVVTLGIVGLLALLSEWRRRSFNPRPTEDGIFRCSQCHYVYTDDPDVDRSRCPQCGRFNDPVQF